MEKRNDEPIGSKVGAALTACGSWAMTKSKRLVKQLIRGQRHLLINNSQGGNVYLYIVDYTKEEIKQLIMEYNNHQKPESHE